MPSMPTADVLLALILLGSTGCWVITPGDVADHEAALDADTGSDPFNPDFDDPGSWEAFDLSALGSDWTWFQGSTFDGRYLYLAHLDGLGAYRFDTQGGFTDPASWTSFGFAAIDDGVSSLGSVVFDGRYVYYGPGYEGDHLVLRHDPTQDFESAASWTTWDLGRTTYANGTSFDGRYAYFHCLRGGAQVRYDTQGPFTDAGSWEEFDASDFVAYDGRGMVFDGRYVYLGPWEDGQFGRYDTQGEFTARDSWTSFDTLVNLDPNASITHSGTTDGRYIYFSSTWEKSLLRHDTEGEFLSSSSWVALNVDDLGFLVYFSGAVFDGRYVIYPPNGQNEARRYDTRLAFDDPEAWESFAQLTLGAGVTGFGGGAFDGRYVYLIPQYDTTIVRFHAREPARMPDTYHGSFF